MRRLLTIVAALLLVILGGLGWILYQSLRQPNDGGQVRGVVSAWSAFWQGGFLALTGGPAPSLTLIRDGSGETTTLSALPPITAAAVGPDETTLLLVRKDGGQSVFWRYREGIPPAPVTAVRGDVTMMRVSPTGRDVLALIQRDNPIEKQLTLINVESGAMVQVSADSVAADWVERPLAVVSVDTHGQLWYHGLQLDGRVDPPQFLASIASNVAVAPARPELYFVAKTDDGYSLQMLQLVSREQRLIAPLSEPAAGRPIRLRVSPGGTMIALTLPREAAAENDPLLYVDVSTGKTEPIQAIGRDVRWQNDDVVLYERVTGSAIHLWRFPLGGEPQKLFETPMSRFAS